MKTSLLVSAALVWTLSFASGFAQDAKPSPGKPAMSMDMDKHMAHMHENMKRMQSQMDRMRKTTDPKERQKLMQEHMQAMHENMKMMQGMSGGAAHEQHGEHKSGTATPGKMAARKEAMSEGDMMKRHDMMSKRMDMMQMMMEQMMQHQQMMQSPPAR